MDFWKSKDRLLEEFGGGMNLIVEVSIDFRVIEPKIGTEIDDF